MSDNKNTYELPVSKESEMMVLGCMINANNSLRIGISHLEKSVFFHTEHQIIFTVLSSAERNNKLVGTYLICEELRRLDKLEIVGGVSYIMDLAQYAAVANDIEQHIEIIIGKFKLREIINQYKEVLSRISKEDNPSGLILELQEKLKYIEKIGNAKDNFRIKFLNEFEENFLLNKPSSKSMLLEYLNESGNLIGFLPKGIVASVVGGGGIGKTHLLAQIAISVATGTSFLDQFMTTPHCGYNNRGNVFFGLGENRYDDIHRVLYKASKKLRSKQRELFNEDLLKEACNKIAVFSFCGQQASFLDNGKPSLYFQQLKIKLKDHAPSNGWSLIILDPVSRLLGKDAESDNGAATQFIALLEELTIDLPGSPTVLFAHHVNKAAMNASNQNQTASRGSSALTDGVRQQFNFYKDTNNNSNLVIFEMTKSNFTPIIKATTLEKECDGYLVRSNFSNSLSKVEKQAGYHKSHDAFTDMLNG